MAAIRRRFTKEERRLFTEGTRVEWLNATRWQPGTVAGAICTEDYGQQDLLPVRAEGSTGIVRAGEILTIPPKHVRLAK
jgi:hypothetical protein